MKCENAQTPIDVKNRGALASHKYEATRTSIALKIDTILEDYI